MHCKEICVIEFQTCISCSEGSFLVFRVPLLLAFGLGFLVYRLQELIFREVWVCGCRSFVGFGVNRFVYSGWLVG